MSCDQFREWMGDAVDGTLNDERRRQLDTHIESCRACGDLLDDLMGIRAAAATLERHTPSPEIWRALAAVIEPQRRTYTSWAPLAAAAALAAMVGAAVFFDLGKSAPTPREQADALMQSAVSELQLAEQHYEQAISTLEKLTADTSALDPAVADAIAQSLATVDQAITDSRTALASDPDSLVVQTSLLEALRTKVALLQETVTLLNTRS